MSRVKCVEGGAGSGKSMLVANRCHMQLLGDQAHVRPTFGAAKCIGYFTPMYEPNPALKDRAMEHLVALNTLYAGFDLSNPPDWDTIDLNRYRHIVFDEIRLNDNVTGIQPCDLYSIRSIEFTVIQLQALFKKARRRAVSITLITPHIPPLWAAFFKEQGVIHIPAEAIMHKAAA